MSPIKDSTLYTSPPNDNHRLPKEYAVYELLGKLNIPYQRLDHEVTASVSDCLDVDKLLGISICKNLFLCNSQKSNFYMLVMPGTKKFVTKSVSSQIGSSRLSFADSEHMERFLNITPGSVSIMGLMNDTEHKVQLLIDRDFTSQKYLGCHPCINTSSLKIKLSDILMKFLPYTGHDPIYVDLQ